MTQYCARCGVPMIQISPMDFCFRCRQGGTNVEIPPQDIAPLLLSVFKQINEMKASK